MMRDPSRIPIILRELGEYWEAHPDLRLGQLVHNMAPVGQVVQVEDGPMYDAIHKANLEAVRDKRGTRW